MERAQGAALPGDEQATAGLAIQPVHELEFFFGSHGAERFDDAEAEPAAAMDSDTRRLVEHDEPLVLADDRGLNRLARTRRHARGLTRRRLRIDADRRHAHDVAL